MKTRQPPDRPTRADEKAAAPKVRIPAPQRVRPPDAEAFARFLLQRHARGD